MVKVVCIRFKNAGRVYYFDPGELDIKRGQHVIVETIRGVEYGLVVDGVKEVSDEEIVSPLKPVLRIATEEDDRIDAENQSLRDEAIAICKEKVKENGLEMKVVEAEYTFDKNKVIFYFTADGRVDFRELVKDLAKVFRIRIELRQINSRDEIKIMGGIGPCGRDICCHSFMSDFVPVSIKMAKEQHLSLNPSKISGICGRLMCCLTFEEETYEDINARMPEKDELVSTKDGFSGRIQSVNALRETAKVIIEIGDSKEIRNYPIDELQFKKMYNKERTDLTEEELAQVAFLEKLEEADRKAKEEAAKEEYGAKSAPASQIQRKPYNKPYNKYNKVQNNSVAPNNQGDKGPRDNKEFKGPKDNNQAENQGHGGKKGYNKFPKKDENVHNNAGNNNMNRKGKKFYPQNHRKSGNRGDK